MKTLRTIWLRLRSLGQRRVVAREIDEELRYHIEQRTAENIAAGMRTEDAACEAHKRFGNLQSIREECRDTRGASFGEASWRDIGFGLRTLRKNPGFAAVAILTVGLGVGANTAMFGVLWPLLRPKLPYADSGQLLRVYRTSPQAQYLSHSRADFVDYREQNHVFSRLAAFLWEGFNFGEAGHPAERLTALRATADFFPILGIQPILGRVFTEEDTQPGRDQVAVLSYAFWMSHSGGDTNVIGRTLRFDAEPVVVIGVMPAAFDFPMLFGNVEAWRPFPMTLEERGDRENRFLNLIGRLKSNMSFTQAQAEMAVFAARLGQNHPLHDGGCGVRLVRLPDSFLGDLQRRATWFLFGLTSFVLLIACANLANLQLARNTGRSRELAVRAALGATRWRLLRQLLTESMLISLLGGVLGLLFAAWCGAILAHTADFGFRIASDYRVILFLLACCLVTVVAFGTAPAWLAARPDVHRTLKESSRGQTGTRAQHRFQRGLIVGEVALAFMLLAGAGGAISVLQRFARLDPGWRMDGLLTAEVAVPGNRYPPERRLALFRQLEERLAGLPGVSSASFTTDLPILAYWNTQPVQLSDRPAPSRSTMAVASCPTVGADYFRTLGINLHEGRFFNAGDQLDRPAVVIINETMARQFWPAQNALGKRITIGDPNNPQWMEIVGVVGDVRFPADVVKPETRLQVYRPWMQDSIATGGSIVLRTTTSPEALLPALRRVMTELDPDLPVYSVRTVRQAIRGMMRTNHVMSSLLVVFGLLGLVLAAIGIYGVTSYSTAQRTGEFGIRMALGAQRGDVLWLVLRQGLSSGVLGSLLGFSGSFVVLRVLDTLIPQGSLARDPVMLAGVPVSGWLVTSGVAIGLLAVALFACYLPARNAAKADPMTALRYE